MPCEALLAALAGRVLLAHYAPIETDFLPGRASGWGERLPACVVVDTLELEQRASGAAGGARAQPGSSVAVAARERRGCRSTAAHEALVDALACAELSPRAARRARPRAPRGRRRPSARSWREGLGRCCSPRPGDQSMRGALDWAMR